MNRHHLRHVHRLLSTAALAVLALLLVSRGAAADWSSTFAADPTTAAPGDVVTFTAVATSTPPNNQWVGVDFAVTIPAQFTGVSWTCSGAGVECVPASGTGNDIHVVGNIPWDDETFTVTLLITATVAAGAAPGIATADACMTYIYTPLFGGSTRALPLMQEEPECFTADITIAEPTPTPEPTATPTEAPTGEPTETATAEPTPATPIVIETETPAPPAPTPTTGPVTQLPSTGAGDDHTNPSVLAAAAIAALFLMVLLAAAGIRAHRR
jgi:cell division septation protein DedD